MRDELYGDGFFTVVKAAGLALALSLLGTVIFAVVLRVSGVDKAIYPITQTIKGIALITGVLVCVRGERGWLKGGGAGLLFTALSYLAFSAIGGDFSLGWLILLEVLIAALVGAISGSLAVNLRRA